MKVLIVPWGNPFQWEPITYEFEGIKLKNKSSLPLLIEALKPEKIIIIALDTLANFRNRDGKPEIELKNFSEYLDVKEDVKDRIKWFLKKEILENILDPELKQEFSRFINEELKIIVVPGVGIFPNIAVEGEMLDFYYYILYKLARELPVDDLEVYLDLTHGINFMPTLIYRALNNLLGLAAFVRNVRFVVLNSEPFPQGFIGEEKAKVLRETVLHIRKVEDRNIHPKPIYSKVNNEKLTAFIASLANGFPLVFAKFYPKINELESVLDDEFQEFLKNIEVKEKKIKRNKNLSDDFKTISKLFYLIRILNSIFDEFSINIPKDELSARELKSLVGIIFKKIRRLEMFTKRDIDIIKKFVKRATKKEGEIRESLLRGERVKYLEVFNFIKDTTDDVKESVDPRNFIAHSGLAMTLIYVKWSGNDVFLSYDENRLQEIIKYSIESIKIEGRS